MKKALVKVLTILANGNPGAITFLMEVLASDTITGSTIIAKIDKTNIKGTDLYVMWSDLCNKDINKVKTLCEQCPDDILIDACSRQDYSGRELVKEYLN